MLEELTLAEASFKKYSARVEASGHSTISYIYTIR